MSDVQELALQAHDAAYAAGYYPQEVSVYAPSLLMPNGWPALSLSASINNRRWAEEQRGRAAAQIGTVFEVKTCPAGIHGDEWVTYALMRVDTPDRWINFSLHYKTGESCMALIHNYLTENNIQTPLNPQGVLAPEYPIAWLSLNTDHSWSVRA
jgi:hypothetical protein